MWGGVRVPGSAAVVAIVNFLYLASVASFVLYAALAIPRLWPNNNVGSLFALFLPAPTPWLSRLRWTGVGLF
ncbi:MAG: hypothetical protein V4466_14090 [Pseudomonadota bacterium]